LKIGGMSDNLRECGMTGLRFCGGASEDASLVEKSEGVHPHSRRNVEVR
jgi:hypothetical protein